MRTIFRGEAANIRREYFSQKDEKIKNSFLEYYKEHYPSIVEKENFEIKDNLEKNEITITESYTIQNPGVPNEGDKRLNFWHNVDELHSYIDKDTTQPRTMPLEIRHPVLFVKHIEILLPPVEWAIQTEKIDVNDETFNFMKSEEVKNNQYTIFYHYSTQADHVKAEKTPEYIENINKMKATGVFN